MLHLRFFALCALWVGLVSPLLAQLDPYYEYQYLAAYEEAQELFDKRAYGPAMEQAERFLAQPNNPRAGQKTNDLRAEAHFIQAASAYYLQRGQAIGLLQSFRRNFASHTRADQAAFFLGESYFEQGNYTEAIQTYGDALDSDQLSDEARNQLTYHLAYCYYQDDQIDPALSLFETLAATDQDNPFQEDAAYYRAVILYEAQDYDGALTALRALEESDTYARDTRVYLANTLLKLRKFDELNVLADELIAGPRIRPDEAQIYYVVANASYERNDFARAAAYYRLFEQNRGSLNRADYFRYGYAHYQLKEYPEAIPVFQKALGQRYDSLTQVTSYYLGFCFLKEKDEANARVAFKKAAEGERLGNPEIAKDALYQYGKLSFSTENYSDALEAFTSLIQRYPKADFIPELQGLIGETYLKTRNYPQAVAYFESVPRNTSRARKAYQTVCYFYGIELFERADYAQARSFFQKAVDNAFEADLSLSAEYWLGETQFRQKEYTASAATFKAFLNRPRVNSNQYYVRGFYGLAWARFKLKEYGYAFTSFESYIDKSTNDEPLKLRVDAYLRAGDCQFLLKNYAKANDFYSRTVRFGSAGGDYAAYQLAESYYRQSNYAKAVETFAKSAKSFPQSEFRDDALDRASEISLTWLKDYSGTITYAKQLVEDYPRSPLAPDAYNRMGLAAYNLGRNDEAVSHFKRVVTNYGRDREAAQIALDNLAQLVSEKEFDRILKDYRNQVPDTESGGDLARLVFNTGKDRYFSENYASATEQFGEYIKAYPTGPDYFEALLFRGRAYQKLNQPDKALADFERVYGANTTNPFTPAALEEAGDIEYARQRYDESLNLYTTLQETAGKLANRVIGWFGMAKNLRALKRYAEAQDALLNVASNNEVAVYSRTEALVGIGTCQYLRGQLEDAFETFSVVEGDFKNAFGAESQHMKTQIFYDQGVALRKANQLEAANEKFEAVKEATRYMANNYPTFNYWKARTFFVVANAFYELGNTFQAKGTLESLANEDRFPDVKEMAQKRLAEIQ
jgi:tetratricopeptide (TPR) repeat protein